MQIGKTGLGQVMKCDSRKNSSASNNALNNKDIVFILYVKICLQTLDLTYFYIA